MDLSKKNQCARPVCYQPPNHFAKARYVTVVSLQVKRKYKSSAPSETTEVLVI